ncbi:hypothetical protein NDI56_08445 [Haloarcula sp. S1CR25-12]|uniref:Ribbon-helix-helix protein, CopG family n=1 Tax=Haloarcula saliterrae TaxID=2950534 RepID=A0ABU2FB03_9EURY|nr:hypothetical protein [Haloarcula sp. S1CR25-12]MDS0259419.1 hypothetical protein [Haloarcula sp. S1CR25-12]
MTTAVKVDDEAKARLEELQAQIRLDAGKKVTQQELLSRLIDDAYDSRKDVVESFRDTTAPASDDDVAAFLTGSFDSGTDTDEDDIDDILYG